MHSSKIHSSKINSSYITLNKLDALSLTTNSLLNLSPLDGRYIDKVAELRPLLSEFALIKYRVYVELKWLEMLLRNEKISQISYHCDYAKLVTRLTVDFSLADAVAIKKIESTTKHDVKAVEYFMRQQLENYPNLRDLAEFIHFACTSEDINNISYALMLQQARSKLEQDIQYIIAKLSNLSLKYKDIAMLARTHGQSASPTTMGKELVNISMRLLNAYNKIGQVNIYAKINGAVGNYNAHIAAYPDIDWFAVSVDFITSLGLKVNLFTTQIEPHDYISELCHAYSRLNHILIDCCRDIWSYIAIGYFSQKVNPNEIGSSTMPHKVNPIDFENAEGNLGLANALLEHFATKLPISRWQRDLTDSTVLRNLGVAHGHCVLSYRSLLQGLDKIEVNKNIIQADLAKQWSILAEAVQTVMRKYKIANSYEKLKELTRGHEITQQPYLNFVNSLSIDIADKKYLLALTPTSYVGSAAKQVKLAIELIKQSLDIN